MTVSVKRPEPVSVEKARRILRQLTPDPVAGMIPLEDSPGCVLAEEVRSDIDMPPFEKAMMDGYAVKAADLAETPVTLPVLEEIPAGRAPRRRLRRGECSRIMTGAPLPAGADAVVQVEWTEGAGGRVRILRGVRRGQNVAHRAEDLRVGQRVLSRGALIRPA